MAGVRRWGCGKRWQIIKVETQFKKEKRDQVFPGEGGLLEK